MNPPSLPVAAWCAIAAASCVIYLTVLRRWMPTPSTRTQISLGPLLGAAIFAEAYSGRHMPLSAALGMVS
ncbi:hypothetical protein [Streptomyces sp. TS71-3]|uniref:hypothetical protein n=1 Tax=Streptomyces sp. TS71-3 TaxID=2733862 RepID=UPI001B01F583|nr:hypothetical protein [Streptomyces sp. TS71-3]GHJ40153.1 hypothetical protein Sm713_57620 [Streptomyces sp. TS71-3]